MLALLRDHLPEGPEWSYEVKWDGYRAFAVKRGAQVTLSSRRGSDFTRTYPAVAAAVQTIQAKSAILDGEIVALDAEGRPSFQALQHRSSLGPHTLAFYAFDVLEREGRTLTNRPLRERRKHLATIVRGSAVLQSEPLAGTATQVTELVKGFGLEGIVAKRLDSIYEGGQRSGAWTKVKLAHRQEFVIGGFRPNGNQVDALVVGYYDGPQPRAAGKLHAGMNAHTRRELFGLLSALAMETCPFVNLPTSRRGHWGEGITAEDMATFVWVEPRVVVECTFTEWTRDGNLRHAAFVAIRTDKRPADIRRE